QFGHRNSSPPSPVHYKVDDTPMLWPSLGSKVMNSDAAGRPPFHASGYGRYISLNAGSATLCVGLSHSAHLGQRWVSRKSCRCSSLAARLRLDTHRPPVVDFDP